jgi:hypothetical protein
MKPEMKTNKRCRLITVPAGRGRIIHVPAVPSDPRKAKSPSFDKIRRVKAELFLNCKASPNVAVMLVDGALLVVHTNPRALPSLIRVSMTVGVLTSTGPGSCGLEMFAARFPDKSLLPAVHKEVFQWWSHMDPQRRRQLKLRFHNQPDLTW